MPPGLFAGRAMTHSLGDFLFDGAVLAKEGSLPPRAPNVRTLEDDGSNGASEEEKLAIERSLQPLYMFPGKDALLSSAILMKQGVGISSSSPERLPHEDLERTQRRWQSQILTPEQQAETDYYRWQNRDCSSQLPQTTKPPQYVLIEESRLQELADFESRLRREKDIIESNTNGEFTTTSIFDHRTMDPRTPTADIKKALKSLSDNRFKVLHAEWEKLEQRWKEHSTQFGFGKPHVYQKYATATLDDLSDEMQNPGDSWLLRACPPHEYEKKLLGARRAAQAFLLRSDRDSMIYEDDRSFLVQQSFEARARSLDYERYCDLASIFGPMAKAEWDKARSRPGLLYFSRASSNAIKIQRVWDIYWSMRKLRRFLAARRIQTKFRAWYGYKSLHPLVILRLRFGKRTYFIFCWSQWRLYNSMVRKIRERLAFVRLRWPRKCFDAWQVWAHRRGAGKRAILMRFKQKFDTRFGILMRIKAFKDKSKRIKTWLRRTWNCPQWTLWVDYVHSRRRLKAISLIIAPVQAFFRMVRWRKFYLRLRSVLPALRGFVSAIQSKTTLERRREVAVQALFSSWGPQELARRKAEGAENERRRASREQQVAEEKANAAIAELKKHLRGGNGKAQLRQLTTDVVKLSGGSLTWKGARIEAEGELLSRCFACHLDLNIHEYRSSTKAPHIACADPICKLTFSCDDDYRKHISEQSKDEDENGEGGGRGAGARRQGGGAVLAKAMSMKRAKEAAVAAAAAGTRRSKASSSSSSSPAPGRKHTAISAEEQIPNTRPHSTEDFAETHILLRSDQGREALRHYLSRRFGVGALVNTLDCWVEISNWRRASIHGDSFFKRALNIFEVFLRPECSRPIEIDLDDGDMRDDVRLGDGEVTWMGALLSKCEAVKSRVYEGFYQAAFTRNFIHRLFGMRGRGYQTWTDERMLAADIFDGVEFACICALHRAVWRDLEERVLFLSSREHAHIVDAEREIQVRMQASLLEDCRLFRLAEVKRWVGGFRLDEARIGTQAEVIANSLLDAEVERLLSRGIAVGRKEALFRVRHIEQALYEPNMAMCDDAVDWAFDHLLNHIFDFYTPKLLNTMLEHEEMVEGLLEYAGMLKGKKLKKHLEVTVSVGVREDWTWFKDLLREAIAEDKRLCPKDYLGAVRMLQRVFRGVIGRTKARKLFIAQWAKKWDAERERFYYVNQHSGDIDWVRPLLFHTLFPKRAW